MVVRLVSWNVNRRELVDDVGLGGLQVDLALLQEAPRPTSTEVVSTVPDPAGDWTTRGWQRELRTCIVQLTQEVELRAHRLRQPEEEGDALGVSRRGTLAVADVLRGGDLIFTVASVYSAWERPSVEDGHIYADASAHRLLSDLAPLVTGRPTIDAPLVVAGDLNLLLGYGEYGNDYWAARYQAVFDRAAAMGLRMVGPQLPAGRPASPWPSELPRESRNVPTFHSSRQTPESATRQLDYVFASEAIADRVRVRALNDVDDWGPSDHCRVEIVVDL